ncbi:capsule biosynthesis protein CapK [Polaribacter sp. SA4-10]|uniref:phenylacetate--CoA ligase family protein n=1 Tax=Polaribacter sp. SA4-10 TaxID=754397 RepID=UPI000B558917|nr:phenylacetate--CoA ligase family protein [Polaribacter sp. SA4-10]ARV05516.1 capsule biosynthesis protein CapK [Polaribacter sp. SA4-10]
MFHKLIYLIGQKYRNPSLGKIYKFLKISENWSLNRLEDYQLKKLKEILKTANSNSPFYKKKFTELNIDINTIKKLSDIKLIPILTKEELITNSTGIHTKIQHKKKFSATTSGTSGQSLKFFREESADSFNRAAIQRGYSWYTINPWDRNGYFWGFDFSFISKIKNNFLDSLQNRFRIFSFEEKSLKRFIKKTQKAKYIHGYSSMIYQAAVVLNKLDLPKPKNIKMVKGTSEKIFDSYQNEIKKAFGVKIVGEYGATESGIIAFECKEGNMHINMEGVLVEEIDNEILVTNLQMTSFPIIRYKLGDYVSLAPRNKKCLCGKAHLIIDEVTGRVGERVYGFKNMYPSLYFYYIFKNLSKNEKLYLNYQVVQDEKGILIFLIEQELAPNNEEKLKSEIDNYFNLDVSYTIKPNSKLITSKGKLKNFISTINE